MDSVNIFWFRRDLRIDDNTALYHALKSGFSVLPIFIFDTEILNELPKNDTRVEFIHRQISSLYKEFNESLLVKKGNPSSCIEELINNYPVNAVYANHDYEPYAIKRDSQIKELLNEKGIQFITFKDQVIFEKNDVLSPSGQPYKVFTPYMKKWLEQFKSINLKINSISLNGQISNKKFSMPALSEIGFTTSEIPVPGAAVKEEIIAKYLENRDFPSKNGTSRLGIHLRFGTISIRKVVEMAESLSTTWLNELIWREFYMMILYHFPDVVEKAFKSKYDKIPWRNDPESFKKWCEGMTGYPLVDAGMRELNHTGFMHNRVRMVVASFLAKHLLIDWRWGEAYFAQKLLDYELASNNGGWQWAAGTGTDAQPYFRIFNPEAQAAKFDPQNEYIKKWIPEISSPEYPEPIVNHRFARERALKVFKEAING